MTKMCFLPVEKKEEKFVKKFGILHLCPVLLWVQNYSEPVQNFGPDQNVLDMGKKAKLGG